MHAATILTVCEMWRCHGRGRVSDGPHKAYTRFSPFRWKSKKFKSRHHLTTGKVSRRHPLSATYIQLIHGFPSNFWHWTLKTINYIVHLCRKCVALCSIVVTLKFCNICGIDIYYKASVNWKWKPFNSAGKDVSANSRVVANSQNMNIDKVLN